MDLKDSLVMNYSCKQLCLYIKKEAGGTTVITNRREIQHIFFLTKNDQNRTASLKTFNRLHTSIKLKCRKLWFYLKQKYVKKYKRHLAYTYNHLLDK